MKSSFRYIAKTHRLSLIGLATVTVIFGAIGITKIHAQTFNPLDGLIAYWPLDGNARDESGKGNHGTVNGPVPTVDRSGKEGGAMLFDGVNDLIDIGVGVKPPLPITVMAWLKPSSLTGTRAFFRNDYATGGGSRGGVSIFFDALTAGGASVVSGVWNGSANLGERSRQHVSTTGQAVSTPDWQHVAVVIAGVFDRKVFLNGSEVPLGQYVGEGRVMTYTGAAGAIGHVFEGAQRFFAGAMDELLVYNKALSRDEIRLAGNLESLFVRIRKHPQPQQVPAGGTSQFSVVAVGEAPLTYQWFRDGAQLPGETSTNLVLKGVIRRDEGNYSVRVSNLLGSVESLPARLDVLPFELHAFLAVELEFPSQLGKNYVISGSSNLVNWLPIRTNAGTGQLIQEFIRTRSTPFRFFQAEETN